MKKRNGIRALALAGLLICLSGCGAAAEPTQPPTEDPALLVTEFALAANDGAELAQLDQYPNLKANYQPDDGNTEVYYLKNATAQICSFGAPTRTINF